MKLVFAFLILYIWYYILEVVEAKAVKEAVIQAMIDEQKAKIAEKVQKKAERANTAEMNVEEVDEVATEETGTTTEATTTEPRTTTEPGTTTEATTTEPGTTTEAAIQKPRIVVYRGHSEKEKYKKEWNTGSHDEWL